MALLEHPEYWGPTGQEFTFDASASYSPHSSIAKYDWDYNGDGTYEESTTTPVAKHTYQAKSDGVMQVRMTDAGGLVANASAAVHVGSGPRDNLPAAPLNVKTVATSTTGTTSTIQVTWESSDPRVGVWGLSVDGIPGRGRRRCETDCNDHRRLPGEDRRNRRRRIHFGPGDGRHGMVTLLAASSSYNFSGFMAPVDPAPAVNAMQAGRAVPMKFSIAGDHGLGILPAGSPTSAKVTCDTGAALAKWKPHRRRAPAPLLQRRRRHLHLCLEDRQSLGWHLPDVPAETGRRQHAHGVVQVPQLTTRHKEAPRTSRAGRFFYHLGTQQATAWAPTCRWRGCRRWRRAQAGSSRACTWPSRPSGGRRIRTGTPCSTAATRRLRSRSFARAHLWRVRRPQHAPGREPRPRRRPRSPQGRQGLLVVRAGSVGATRMLMRGRRTAGPRVLIPAA